LRTGPQREYLDFRRGKNNRKKLEGEELHSLYSSNIIRVIKTRKMRRMVHEADIGERSMYKT
jgi:hypothetical protein